MKPNSSLIKIKDNERLAVELLSELVLEPRLNALKWSEITKQSPGLKIGYPGQHLASIVTGMQGKRTGARGDDLEDGTEVKSCNRVDQLDTCKSCKSKVFRVEAECSHCGSTNIDRKEDSKWLFTIRSKDDLDLLLTGTPRVLLALADYPHFASGDFQTIRFSVYEIWNGVDRHSRFGEIMTNYLTEIYGGHKKLNAEKTPAPKNFWPFSYQFYLCNPVKVFSAIVTEANSRPKVAIELFVPPSADRSKLTPEPMPADLLNVDEFCELATKAPTKLIEQQLRKDYSFNMFKDMAFHPKANKKALITALPNIDEALRSFLPLRDTDKPVQIQSKWNRNR